MVSDTVFSTRCLTPHRAIRAARRRLTALLRRHDMIGAMPQSDWGVRRRAEHACVTRWLLVLLCLIAQRAPDASRGFVRLDGTSPADAARSSSNLRLGTAARPFAWATATGDLNYD